MRTYTVGKTVINYHLERREGLKRRRIQVTPKSVIVIVPSNDDESDIQRFLKRKERWLYTHSTRMRQQAKPSTTIDGYITGSKILYRGRRLKLHVSISKDDSISIEYRNGFCVSIPKSIPLSERSDVIRSELRLWLKRQIRKDVQDIVSMFSRTHALNPKSVVVKEQKNMWGSCGRDGTINLNWQLIFAPKSVLEYAVLHELCHIKYRTHDKRFWAFLKKIMPDYVQRKEWLENNEQLLGAL